jgi:apolipoprotein N-acyltransferase
MTATVDYLSKLSPRLSLLAALIAGALLPFSLAPFHIWPLAIISIAVFGLLINQRSLKTVLWRSWFFAVGMYGLGVSWIYVSISGFGGAPAPLACFLVIVFAFFMALLFSIPFYLYGRWFSQHKLSLLLAFPATWLLSEWLRTWLFTGFPWLFAGYAEQHTWLAGWAPVTGVMGLSLITALTAGFIAQLVYRPAKSISLIAAGIITALLWLGGFALQQIEWTQLTKSPTTIAIVQPNINQEDKWKLDSRETTMDLLRTSTEPLWGHNIIIWPEAAVTEVYSQALPFLNEMNRKAADTHSGLITGIIYDDAEKEAYYNSIATFGDAIGIYHKRRLVPFGEYVPMEWLRNLIEFFNLPTSIISLGPQDQRGLKSGELFITPLVCYEVAYPDLVASSARESQLLLSVSNLGWFGDSLGRHQFMQMAQMRAMETKRYHAYSTNNGPSAIIDPRGNITEKTRPFTQTVLSSEVFAATGDTPFMKYGSAPLVIVSVIGLLAIFPWRLSRKAAVTVEE